MRYVNVRDFKTNATRYLNSKEELVITRRQQPVATVSPIAPKSLQAAVLKLGQIFAKASISKHDALRALDCVRGELARENRR